VKEEQYKKQLEQANKPVLPEPQSHPVSTNQESDTEEESIPFQMIDVKPTFQGGDANTFSKWVNERLVYPEVAKKNGQQGRVTLQFTIGKDGNVTKVKVLRGVSPELDAEAVRVVSMSPAWTPGIKDGKPVSVTYTFPIIFAK
jgi:TonB family protein